MNDENSNQFKHSWDRECSKLSKAGQNFVGVAEGAAYCFAHITLSYPQIPEEIEFYIQAARYSCELTDPDREVIRELSRLAAETSETVEGYIQRIYQPTYYKVLAGNLELAKPEVNLVGVLQRLKESGPEEWANTLAHLDPVDAEFAKEVVKDKKRGAAGTIS